MFGRCGSAPPSADKTTMADIIILSSGDLPALVAARLAAEEGPSVGTWSLADHPTAAAAVGAQAELLDLEVIGSSMPGEETSIMLLRAARAAAAAGAARLVWPEAVNADLDRMSREADRALLVSRLIALEPDLGPAAGAGRFEVQTPLLDLSDAQVAELAIDLDVPIWRCWWWPAVSAARPPVPLTCSEVSASAPELQLESAALDAARGLAERWTTALRRIGWSEDIELASITSG
jgi:hypothetical protein